MYVSMVSMVRAILFEILKGGLGANHRPPTFLFFLLPPTYFKCGPASHIFYFLTTPHIPTYFFATFPRTFLSGPLLTFFQTRLHIIYFSQTTPPPHIFHVSLIRISNGSKLCWECGLPASCHFNNGKTFNSSWSCWSCWSCSFFSTILRDVVMIRHIIWCRIERSRD